MSAKENNSEVAVEKGAADEKAPAEKCDLKGTKRASEDKTPEAKKYRKEENGGGGEPDAVGEYPEVEEDPEIEEEDEEEDIGEGEEDELEEDEELEEEDMGAEEEEEDAVEGS